MADLLDTFLTGVPNTPSGTPQIFGSNAVSQSAARGIVSDRLARTTYLADAKAKLGEFRDRETTRAQGQAALGQLTGLDPVNDPDYLNKVQGIIARNPGATLDATVNNFLKIQGDAFEQVDQTRQRDAEIRRQQQLQEERDRRETELSETRTRSELQLRREAALQGELDQLPPSLVDRFSEYRDFGFNPFESMAKVKEDAAAAGALSELSELGISPDDDEVRMIPDPNNPKKMISTGVFDEQGRIDPAKVNRLKAKAQAEKVQSKEQEMLKKDAMANLRYLQRELEDQTMLPERRAQLEAALRKNAELAGLEGPLTDAKESGKVENPAKGSAVMQDKTKTIPPDTSRADRFLPK
jgi:hypothetical protein